jgi:hypothetical protein
MLYLFKYFDSIYPGGADLERTSRSLPQNDTRYEGVSAAAKKNGEVYFRASLTKKCKHISLGSFPSASEAHEAYLEGMRILRDASLSPESYQDFSPLPFEKWISLINFRDNGIYFSNPIYVRRRFFYYYLSPAKVLKFDIDDLFYFSSHKIMCRGNHYFVADYGMQVSIPTRYGIKPYAREGKDFRFINGDPLDFRRENLEVINIYQGISHESKNGQYVYTVRIHVRGNYLVGRYTDEAEAAIAYNKAIDVLVKNGVTRTYTPNYIDGLSPRKYAEIYTNLKISPKIYAYRP